MANFVVVGTQGAHVISPTATHERRALNLTLAEAGTINSYVVRQFPANTTLLRGTGDFSVESDALGTSVVFDVGIGDAAGTIATALISASTIGALGGFEEIGTAAVPLDVSGLYLIVDVTTAASAADAAGAITCQCRTLDGESIVQVAT